MALSCVVASRNWPVSSKINIPASMATTNVIACELPNASNAIPGPGQIPESPHPTPKIRLPVTSGRSMSRLMEISHALFARGAVPLPTMEKTTRPIEIAPPMTKANEGSQRPARSRNPSTLLCWIIPDRQRPVPKINPARNENTGIMSLSLTDDMTCNEHRNEAGQHEKRGRNQGARRQAREAANTVTAGAPRSEASPESDEHSRDREHSGIGTDGRRLQRRETSPRQRSQKQTQDKQDAPSGISGPWLE